MKRNLANKRKSRAIEPLAKRMVTDEMARKSWAFEVGFVILLGILGAAIIFSIGLAALLDAGYL